MKLTEICLVNTWSDRFSVEGKLSLLHVNDTVHVMEYKDNERSIAVDIDIVELRTPDNTVRFTFPRGSNDRLIFRVDDEAEFSVFCKAKEDCQAICNMKLHLDSMLRDAYYSGVQNNLDPDAKINQCDEMERLKKENPSVYFNSLLTQSELKRDTMIGSAHKIHKENGDENAVRLADVRCVYCESSKVVCKDLDFILHPNVSQTTNGKPVFMCGVCIENWKEFRDNAEHEGQLIFPEEVNEEVCAVCSDTPESLVLCGECPRSFCNHCLLHLLTAEELRLLDNSTDEDWVCICCVAGQSPSPPLGRPAWKMLLPAAGRRGLTYGSVVPYTKKNQSQSKTAVSNSATPISAVTSSVAVVTNSTSTVSKATSAAVEAAVIQGAPLLSALAGLSSSAARSHTQQHHQQQHQQTQPSRAVEATSKSGRAGAGRKATTQDMDDEGFVDSLATYQAMNKSSHNNRGKRMEKRQRNQSGELSTSGAPALDEKYYFGQYVGYYNLLCEDVAQRPVVAALLGKAGHKGGGKRKVADEIPTDDVCFLCKDGGDLIECDWKCAGAKHGERCLKVYHTYCLDFEVSEADGEWCCPRHFCDMCGNRSLKYICKYCPVSICATCPEKIVSKYGHARYCEVKDPLWGAWCHTPVAAGVQSIVCQTCTEMLEVISSTAVDNFAVSSNSTMGIQGTASKGVMLGELAVQKRFPGTYEGSSSGGGSVFRKESESTLSDERSDTFVFSRGNNNHNNNHSKAVPVTVPAPKSSLSGSRSRVPPAPAVVVVQKTAVVSHAPAAVTIPIPSVKGAVYRRWSDAEAAVLRAAVKVHGDKAEDIKVDPRFAPALRLRNVEAIWNRINHENLVPSILEVEVEEECSEDLCNEGLVAKTTIISEEEKEQEQEKKPADSTTPDSNQPPTGEDSVAMESIPDSAEPSSAAALTDTLTDTPGHDDILTVPRNKKVARGKGCTATKSAEPLEDSASASGSAVKTAGASGIAPNRSSPRLSGDVTEPQIALPSAKNQAPAPEEQQPEVEPMMPVSGKKGRGRPISSNNNNSNYKSTAEGKVSSKGKPASATLLALPAHPAQNEEQKDEEVEDEEEVEVEEEVPRVSTRVTRQKVEEALLSTRSGKKLYLTGSDLLPSLNR